MRRIIVISRSRKDATWRNSRLLGELNRENINALKSEPGSDIMIFGSGSVVSQLTDLGLIDEYQFVVSPIFLGSGKRLLDKLSKSCKLDLVDSKQYPQRHVMLRYALQK